MPDSDLEDRVLLVLDDPVIGLLPWLAWGLLPYIWPALPSAMLAFALAAGIVALTWWRGERPKILEWSDAALFAVILGIAALGIASINNWFEDHADLVSNGGLAVMAVMSLLVRRPFTAPYTEERLPGLDERLAARLDVVSTAAWAVGLAAAAAVTWYGEYVLDNPNDLWTGWVFQLVPLAIAYNTTLWFDRRAVAIARGDLSSTPTAWQIVRNLVLLAAPVGVLAVMFHEAPNWLGLSLVVFGLVLFLIAGSMVRRHRLVMATPWLLEDFDEDDLPGP